MFGGNGIPVRKEGIAGQSNWNAEKYVYLEKDPDEKKTISLFSIFPAAVGPRSTANAGGTNWTVWPHRQSGFFFGWPKCFDGQ